MRHQFFAVAMLLPAVAFCLVVLSTFYGWAKAFLAISWVPMALYLIMLLMINMSYEPPMHHLNLGLMLKAVGWTSFVQGLIGVVITFGSALKKEDWVIPAIATLLTILPFFLIR